MDLRLSACDRQVLLDYRCAHESPCCLRKGIAELRMPTNRFLQNSGNVAFTSRGLSKEAWMLLTS